MLKQQRRPAQRTARSESVEASLLREGKRETPSIDPRESLDPSEQKHAPEEQKSWPFLRSAEADRKLLKINYAKRWFYRDSVSGMLAAMKRVIKEAKRDGYDDALFATYQTCRDIARPWGSWGDGVYAIFNNTLEELERYPQRRKQHFSDPELMAENERIRRLIIAKEQSISILEESKRDLERAVWVNKQIIKQKNVRIAELGGSDDPSLPSSPEGSLGSSPLPEDFEEIDISTAHDPRLFGGGQGQL